MRSLTPRLIVLSVAILLALLLAEVAVRLFALGPQIAVLEHGAYRLSENPEIGYEIAPGSVDNVHFKHNGAGLRGEEILYKKEDGVFRIACVGDSITYGNGMFPYEPYPRRLQELLNHHVGEDLRKFEVFNYGVSGYSIRQVLATAQTRLEKFSIDLIIYGYCLNDPQVYSLENDILLSKLSSEDREFLEQSKGGVLTGEANRPSLLQKSRIYVLARYVMQKQAAKSAPAPVDEPDDPNFPRSEWNGVKGHDDPQYQAKGKGEAESYYASLHAEGHPGWDTVTYALNALGKYGRSKSMPVHLGVFPYLIDLPDYDLAETHQRVLAEAGNAGLVAHDLYPASNALQTETGKHIGVTYDGINFDQLHPGKEAHDLYARLFLYEMVKAGQIPGAPSLEELRLKLAGDEGVGAKVFGQLTAP